MPLLASWSSKTNSFCACLSRTCFLGFVIEAAATFKEAVLKARSTYHELAAAVVDLGLPDRPGQDLIAELRALRPDLPIILATGYADDDIRQRLAPVARLQILTKPFASDDLMAALERIGVRF
jgi:ActR/RegA family two-component response regulator